MQPHLEAARPELLTIDRRGRSGTEQGEWLPRVTDHTITLPRVVDVLNRWAPITILHGMSGYGKTTQIACWLRDLRPTPELLWLDSSEQDPRDALRTWVTRRLPTLHSGRAVRRAVIVIDDAHQLIDKDNAGFVVDLVRSRHHLHVIAAASGRTHLESLADGRVQSSIVPGGDLLFRPREIAALARQLGVALTDEQIARLHTEVGGWPAAVRIVLDEKRAGAEHLPITRAERYLRHTVLPDLAGSRTARLSMRFALAERLTHRLIHDLADGTSPREVIDVLEGAGYTDIRHLADDVELVLPGFVRRTLRDHYTAAEPDTAQDMHRRLAAWYASRPGPYHDLYAIQHARAAKDWKRFEASWTRAGASLAVTRPDEIERVLRDLPGSVIERHPSIAVLREALVARHPGGTPTTQWTTARWEFARLANIVKPSSLSRMPASDALLIGAGQLLDLRRRGQTNQADAVTSRITAAWSRRRERGESAGDSLSWFYLQRGITDHLRLRHADASRWYRLSWQHRRAGDVSVGRVVAGGLALIESMAGRHDDADDWMRQHRNINNRAATSPREPADAIVAVASQLEAVDRLDEKAAELPAAIAQAAAASEFWAFAALARSRWELMFGRPATGLSALARADHHDDHSRASTVLVTRAKAELLLAIGQGHRAMQMLNAAGTDSEPMLAVPLAWLHLLAANPAAASQLAAKSLVQERTTTPDRIELLVISAMAAVRLGEGVEARTSLADAISVAADSGVMRPFALPPRPALESLQDTLNLNLPDKIRRCLASVPAAYPEALSLVRLTRRERQIVAALQRGFSRDQIAEHMFVSINTVKKQLATLYSKLDVTSRSAALARLDQLGFVVDAATVASAKPSRQHV